MGRPAWFPNVLAVLADIVDLLLLRDNFQLDPMDDFERLHDAAPPNVVDGTEGVSRFEHALQITRRLWPINV